MKFIMLSIIALAASLAGSPAAASESSDAGESYAQALNDVTYAIKRYARCLNNSDGSDDCSSEFKKLKNEQDALETSVSEIELYCEL